VTSFPSIAGAIPPTRSVAVARPAVPAGAAAPAAPVPTSRDADGAGSTSSLIRAAGEQLDQFDRVMEKLRSGMAGGAVTYGGAPAAAQGRIVDRLA